LVEDLVQRRLGTIFIIFIVLVCYLIKFYDMILLLLLTPFSIEFSVQLLERGSLGVRYSGLPGRFLVDSRGQIFMFEGNVFCVVRARW
jgi:hypothetical protein